MKTLKHANSILEPFEYFYILFWIIIHTWYIIHSVLLIFGFRQNKVLKFGPVSVLAKFTKIVLYGANHAGKYRSEDIKNRENTQTKHPPEKKNKQCKTTFYLLSHPYSDLCTGSRSANALNINSSHSPAKFLQPANLTTYTILSLFSLQVEPAPHLLSP